MTKLPQFFSLNVFTNTKFRGKPLAVIDGGEGISVTEMQAIANEFRFPATAFLHAPRDPVNSARLRLFSGSGELAFSAEAAIGVAVLLAQTRAADILARQGVIIALEMGDAAYPVEVIRSRAGIAYAQFSLARTPRIESVSLSPEAAAASLALAREDIGFGGHEPRICRLIDRFAFVPVNSRASLEKARLAGAASSFVFGAGTGVCLYTAETVSQESALHVRTLLTDGAEDAGSGEALAALALVACEFERPKDGEHQMFIEQGHNIGRAARVTLGLTVHGERLAEIRLGGQAVLTMRGELKL